MDHSKPVASTARRRFVLRLGIAPIAAATLPACTDRSAGGATASGVDSPPYKPVFFNSAEWTFLLAACDRLIPADDIGPGALETGVPEFLDRHMQTPYAAGDIWYMQGPFVAAGPEFGYQGRLPVREILRVGISEFDRYCTRIFDGKTFANLDPAQQEALLKDAETGTLKLDNISARTFFGQLLAETRMGYFCDPQHGGNKNMASWKMIGYPGMRADYIDWVAVRDRPYPLPPVDMSGKRG
jgi:gluconate 2-dehydrogenase gamma chain